MSFDSLSRPGLDQLKNSWKSLGISQKISVLALLLLVLLIPVTVLATFNPVKFFQRATYETPITPPYLTPTPVPAAGNRVFVTSTTYNGNLGGLVGADAKCQDRANAASLGGTWKAWLSDNSTAALSRIYHSNNPYTLVNGAKIADNWENLIDPYNPIIVNISEYNTIIDQSLVWTNTNTDGSITVPSNTCNNWSNGTSQYSGTGGNTTFRACSVLPSGQTSCVTWTTKYGSNCDSNWGRLYCFEQPSPQAVTPTPNIPTPTLYIPTSTPTPPPAREYWYSFSPPGTPNSTWDTAKELLEKLTAIHGVKALEIERWQNGGWDAYVYGLPFNDFVLTVGKGYQVRFESPISAPVSNSLAYSTVNSLGYQIYSGWNFVGFPNEIFQNNKSQLSPVELICVKLKSLGGSIEEVNYWSTENNAWVIHTCGTTTNNRETLPATGYMIKSTSQMGSIWNLTIPMPTLAPNPTATPSLAPYPTVTPIPTVTNSKPVISTVSLPTARYFQRYSAVISGYDVNKNDKLTMKITGLPAGMSSLCKYAIVSNQSTASCTISGFIFTRSTINVSVSLSDNKGGFVSKSLPLVILK